MTDQATDTTTEQAADQATVDPYQAILSTITNEEGKQKYSGVDTALESIPAAQSHIQTLEQELAEVREDLSKRKTLEDFVAELRPPQGEPTSSTTEPVSDKIDLGEVVRNELAKARRVDAATSNKGSVAEALAKKFGEKANEMYRNKAAELGMSVEDINSLAAKSPKAVLSYFDSAPQSPVRQHSSVSTSVFDIQPVEAPTRKSIMGITSSSDVASEWQRVRDSVVKELDGG